MGFNTDDIKKVEGGFLVEKDIFMSEAEFLKGEPLNIMNIANEEHYRTTTLVSGSRRITVYVSPAIPLAIQLAVDSALARYNTLGLTIGFVRVTGAAQININPTTFATPYGGISGYPSTGSPYSNIRVNVPLLSGWVQPTVITMITHLLGHAIGFVHTDYMSPSYSCGSLASVRDSVPSVFGAIHIPGTPTGPSAGSWMLTCISNGMNRPFTSADIAALNYLY